jgi:hypothetical protein
VKIILPKCTVLFEKESRPEEGIAVGLEEFGGEKPGPELF